MKSINTTRNTTQNTMRNTTYCVMQSTFQKKILNLIQQARDKVAEAMNLVDEAGAIAGINVLFERGGRSEQDKHLNHSGSNCGSRYNQNNRTDALDECYESDEANGIDEFDNLDRLDEINEVTLPKLADMVSERTCFKSECILCVLNTAFDLMDEHNLMLDFGTISADMSEEDTSGTDEEVSDCRYCCEDDSDGYNSKNSENIDSSDSESEECRESYDDDDNNDDLTDQQTGGNDQW